MNIDNPSYFSSSATTSSTLINDLNRNPTIIRQCTLPKNSKRPLRKFLRSVSSNSADSNRELLIMGEPRLSDIAPDLASNIPPPKIKSDETTSQESLPELIFDDVFTNNVDSTTTMTKLERNLITRRHSIGNFNACGDSFVVTSLDLSTTNDTLEPILQDDHFLRHVSYPRKRCDKCTRGNSTKPYSSMDDILILSSKCSEAANLWVDYFTSYFQQISRQANRKPFRIQYLKIEDNINENNKCTNENSATGVKLQLVVLCPTFLEFILHHPEKCYNLGKLLLADRTLALLLGVSDNDLTETHKRVLPTYFQWQRMGVGQDQDESFTKEFLSQAVSILSKVWKQQSSVVHQEKSGFSVSPKKIRQGQNSVFILLTYPLQKDDSLKISIEKNNEIHEIKNFKRRNPYTIKLSVPDYLTEVTAIVNILVEKNGSIVGSRPIKCESKLRELEQILRMTNDPLEFMCQSFGLNTCNKDQLDNWLLQSFQRNLPPHFTLLANHSTPFAAAVQAHKHSHEEFPTLLHFSAKFGFEKLTLQLMDCPGADLAYDIRNVFDMTPADIAEANGHLELVNILRGYMNMNEFSSMYSKLKEISLKNSNSGEENYIIPKNIDDLYKVCPPPRPVYSEIKTMLPTTAYVPMDTPVKSTKVESMKTSNKKCFDILNSQQINNNNNFPLKNHEIFEDKFQKELLEIINDFKNNIHSISQVEKLVDEWKNRNDVQKSFKEKQEQLNEMRLKYEKIQQEMKDSMKKSTPFERFKKLFGRNNKSKDDKQEISLPILTSQRPISSLSTSSSSSSGRMSTISASSLGDSGTHSDNDEKKNILSSHSEEDFKLELDKAILELNYSPVPAPKPINNNTNYSNKSFEAIQKRSIKTNESPQSNEQYYIQFPPSGLPIPGLTEKPINQEYMNVVVPKECNEKVNQHEYMNFKIITN